MSKKISDDDKQYSREKKKWFDRLYSGACEAEQLFSLDELEAFAQVFRDDDKVRNREKH